MKRQLQGIALILIGIQLTLLGGLDLRSIPLAGELVRDNGNLVIVLPAFAVSLAGLFLCVHKDG